MYSTIPVTLYNNLLTYRYTGKEFDLKRHLLKMITNKIYNLDIASLSDKKLMYSFAEEMYFGVRAQGNKSSRDCTHIKLLNSPVLIHSASGISNTIFLSSDLNDICDRIKLLPQKKTSRKQF